MKGQHMRSWFTVLCASLLFLAPLQAPLAQTPALEGAEVGSWNENYIARFALTDSIRDREPTRELGHTYVHSGKADQQLLLFTQVTNLPGQSITHLWFYEDNLEAEVSLPVGSENWRTFSSKHISPQMIGQWRVLVVGGEQELLLEYNFTVIGAS